MPLPIVLAHRRLVFKCGLAGEEATVPLVIGVFIANVGIQVVQAGALNTAVALVWPEVDHISFTQGICKEINLYVYRVRFATNRT